MFKEIKETIFKKLKEWVVAIIHGNMNKEMEINKRKQMEILKAKSTLTEIKTILKDSIVDVRWQRKSWWAWK